ncbi:MAG: HemK2/MTQ2 family protein methyltransferase [Candidatus Nanohaloarchaea archaeon]
MPDVYRPRKDSFLLKQVLEQQELDGNHVLDMGTGSGIQAAAAADHGATVTAVDIDPAAVEHARQRFNDVENVDVVQSDLFESVSGTFDVVVFNPPYVPSTDDEQDRERTWAGGVDGRQVVDRFIASVTDYVAPGGTVLLVQSTRNDLDTTLQRFTEHGFDARVAVREQLHFEELAVIEAVHTA